MSIHLRKLRFIATTKNANNAGTDSGVEFWFFVNTHSFTTWFPSDQGQWQQKNLDHSWDDRERGRTELYEIDVSGQLGISIGGFHIPTGIAFSSFADVRNRSFWLKMKGDDWWQIDHYYLLGYFEELRGTVPGGTHIDHGWLLMAAHDDDVSLSTDPNEGNTWLSIQQNRTYPCGSILISPPSSTTVSVR